MIKSLSMLIAWKLTVKALNDLRPRFLMHPGLICEARLPDNIAGSLSASKQRVLLYIESCSYEVN
jgi:hypothetical protein